MKYTAAEKRAIDRAYNALRRMTQRSYKAEWFMDEGYKRERRERSGPYPAKALMVEAASDNWNSRAGTLFHFADGCTKAALAGAEARRLADPKEWRRFKRLARASAEAHWDAVNRRLDEIRAG